MSAARASTSGNAIAAPPINVMNSLRSLDHLVCEREQPVGNLDTERTSGFQVEHEFEFGGLLDREVGRLLTFENSPV